MPPPAEWLPFLESAYDQKMFSNWGPAAVRLERVLTDKYGGPDRPAILVANCTAGLTAALLALNIRGPVVVPAFTFAATAQAVLQAGCTPVFAEACLTTWELDPDKLDDLLARQPIAAVIHVRTFGFCRDLDEMEDVTRRHGVPLIVDAAAALGGKLPGGAWAGHQGEMEVFSLHATKVFGVGEGGLILTRTEHVSALRQVLNFGFERGEAVVPGLNGKCSEFHAAVGLAVADHIDGFIERRRVVAAAYQNAVAEQLGVTAPPASIGEPPWQTFPVLLSPGSRADAVVKQAAALNLELRRYYWPALHETVLFRRAARVQLIRAEELARRMICLPIYSDMTDQEVDQVLGILWQVMSPRQILPAAA
jgi:dTDP-4-amino-4,6-dideoxygalactose transaminase